MLWGDEGQEKLRASSVAVFGLGGVGSYAAEALARAGVGTLHLFDFDRLAESNLNRQLFALHSTVGLPKTEAARARLLDVNPELKLTIYSDFFDEKSRVDFTSFDFVIDAIDTVSSKLVLMERCRAAHTPLICSMGTGNKLDPGRLKIARLYETSVCPLARVMRREAKARGLPNLPVLYSDEPPLPPRFQPLEDSSSPRRQTPGSVSFVPPAAGLMLAGYVVRRLLGLPK